MDRVLRLELGPELVDCQYVLVLLLLVSGLLSRTSGAHIGVDHAM